MVRAAFPDKLVLPTIGNNDVIVHDQMPCTDQEAETYFGELFDIWFEGQPKEFSKEAARQTFMQGGYYRHDFRNSNDTLLALNSMYFMTENQCQLQRGSAQLDWLESQITNSSRKFILSMHVFPGLNYFNKQT
jgi:hypothetical protein